MVTARDSWLTLQELRRVAPLVHNITNYVAMDVTANALLAIGASPAMVHAEDEVDEFVGLAHALVVNIGTLSPAWVSAMTRAVEGAAARGKPWVLDPVAVAVTLGFLVLLALRDKVTFMQTRPDVYGPLLVIFLFLVENLVVASQLVLFFVWFGAASSKLSALPPMRRN